MPHSACSLLSSVHLDVKGTKQWGEQLANIEHGVYIVSISADPSATTGAIAQFPGTIDLISKWLQVTPNLTLDGHPATPIGLLNRLSKFWLSNEVILYIGKAECKKGLSRRVGQYYRHKLGETSPHQGGQWIKSLDILSKLYVHYAVCSNPKEIESKLIGNFCSNNPHGPFPFGNLEWRTSGRLYRRDHGIGR